MRLAISHDGHTSFTRVRSGARRSQLIRPSRGQQRPPDARVRGGQRHHGWVEAPSSWERRAPAAGASVRRASGRRPARAP
jgi:hypothetical protein